MDGSEAILLARISVLSTGLVLAALVTVGALGNGAAVSLVDVTKQLPAVGESQIQATPGCVGLALPSPQVSFMGAEAEETSFCIEVTAGDVITFKADTTDRVTTSDLWAGVCRTASYSGCFGTGARFGDDNFPCTFPPPAYACPSGSLVAASTGTLYVVVGTYGTWGGPWEGPYLFKVEVTINGEPAGLDLHDLSGPETGP